MKGLIGAFVLPASLFLVTGSGLSGFILFVVLAYFACAAQDIYKLGRVLDGAAEHASVSAQLSRVFVATSIGKYLRSKVESLEYRLDSLKWQLQAESLRKGKKLNDWFEAVSAEEGSLTGEKVVFESILEQVLKEFRCSNCAILLESPAHGIDLVTRSAGHRFEASLKNLYEPYFRNADGSMLGFFDAAAHAAVASDISIFGYRFSIAEPFRRFAGKDDRAIIWLGYSSTKAPTDLEISGARELASKIEGFLRARQKIFTLSEKITEVTAQDRQKSDYIAHMSHDIRSPLNNIRSILSLFKLETKSPPLIEMLEAASRNCDSLGEMVDGLLDYSQHQEGKLNSRREGIDIGSVIEDVVTSFTVNARSKGITLQFKNAPERCGIHADKKQVKRVLTNLISNAIKYTKFGAVTVCLNGVSTNRVLISVADTGIGMTKSQISSLFNPFVRFHDEYEGVGLGLAVSKILVEKNGGVLFASSEVGKGSTFSLEFDTYPLEGLSTPECLAAEHSYDKTVLLVDDDPDCLESLGRILEREGLKVVKSATIIDAISICNFDVPGIILTDSGMPHGGGEKLISFASKLEGRPRIGLLSGSNIVADKDPITAHVDKIFQKPADIPAILEWIKSDPPQRNEILVA